MEIKIELSNLLGTSSANSLESMPVELETDIPADLVKRVSCAFSSG